VPSPSSIFHLPSSSSEGSAVSLLSSLRTQLRVIGALLMREVLTRYGRKNIGFLWLFIDPMIFTSLIALIWSTIRVRHFENIPVVAFAVTGYSTVLLWRNMTNRCLAAVEPNRSLLYHHSVKIFDFYAARILLEAVGATIAFVMLAALFSLFGLMGAPYDPLQVAVGWFMLAWFGAALALVIAPLTEVSPFVEKIWAPISYISFIFSGAMFLVDMLPPDAQRMMLWVPMVSGVEYLREGYFGPVVRFHYDMGYFAACNLALTLVGLWQVSLMKRRITIG
jgi:ABC-type polysaccharide/polyol phosphate export permease